MIEPGDRGTLKVNLNGCPISTLPIDYIMYETANEEAGKTEGHEL